MYFQPIIIETKSNNIDSLMKSELSNLIEIEINVNELLIISLEEDKLSIGIEDVKPIIEWNFLKSDKPRVSLINHANKLTTEAQNAILKVLEEPSLNSQILLITNNYNSLLNTIRSRCKIIIIDTKEEESNFTFIKEYLNADFIKKENLLNEFLKESENQRGRLNEFLNNLLKYLVSLKQSNNLELVNMIELCESCIKANNNKVNVKLITDTINIFSSSFKIKK